MVEATSAGFRGHSGYILANNRAEFCPSPENLSEAEFKKQRTNCFVEEVSRKDDIQAVARLLPTVAIQM